MSCTLTVFILMDTGLSFHFQIFVYCFPLSKPHIIAVLVTRIYMLLLTDELGGSVRWHTSLGA